MITKLRRKMILMVMSVVTVLLLSIFLILYHSAASGFETRSMDVLRSALQQDQMPPEKPETPEPAETARKSEAVSQPPKPGTLTPPEGREERPLLVLECRIQKVCLLRQRQTAGSLESCLGSICVF